VANNPGEESDTVTITGLNADDTVKIYGASTGGSPLETKTATGKNLTITLTGNLSDDAGAIYVTVTNTDKAESRKVVRISYLAAVLSGAASKSARSAF
jgi:hypothetical protein